MEWPAHPPLGEGGGVSPYLTEFFETPTFWCHHVDRAACTNFSPRTVELRQPESREIFPFPFSPFLSFSFSFSSFPLLFPFLPLRIVFPSLFVFFLFLFSFLLSFLLLISLPFSYEFFSFVFIPSFCFSLLLFLLSFCFSFLLFLFLISFFSWHFSSYLEHY